MILNTLAATMSRGSNISRIRTLKHCKYRKFYYSAWQITTGHLCGVRNIERDDKQTVEIDQNISIDERKCRVVSDNEEGGGVAEHQREEKENLSKHFQLDWQQTGGYSNKSVS